MKNFGSADAFTDPGAAGAGTPRPVDLLDCSGEYAVNLCNIGFDARVAHHMSKFKRIPFVSGPLAYTLSLLFCILGPISSTMAISCHGRETVVEKLVLAVIANGFCYGGGYYPVPEACTADGVMEFCGIRKMSRFQMSRFIHIYQKGLHLNNPRLGYQNPVPKRAGSYHPQQASPGRLSGWRNPKEKRAFGPADSFRTILLASGRGCPRQSPTSRHCSKLTPSFYIPPGGRISGRFLV